MYALGMSNTIIITGGGQGIGQAIAFRFAEESYNIVIAAKDKPEQIEETTQGIVSRGGKVLFCDTDVCNHDELRKLVSDAVAQFGGLDILVNNTSAPCFNDTFHTTPQQFDLILGTSVRAAFFLSQLCYPHLKRAPNPHILNIAPPISIDVQWPRDHLSFAIGKYGMSFCTLGMSAEFEEAGIAVNALWPKTNIATPRLKEHLLPQVYAGSRLPTIMADATYAITQQRVTGKFLIDEEVLRTVGLSDFSRYAIDPTHPLVQTLFNPLEKGMIPISREMFRRS